MTDPIQSIPGAHFRYLLGKTPSLLDVDAKVAGMLGFTQASFQEASVTLLQRVHPEDQDVATSLFAPEQLPGQGALNLRVRHADGRIRCCRRPSCSSRTNSSSWQPRRSRAMHCQQQVKQLP